MDQQNEADIKHILQKVWLQCNSVQRRHQRIGSLGFSLWFHLIWETKKRQNPVSEHLDMKSISETFSLKTNQNQRVNIKKHWMISTLLQKQISSLFIHLSVQQFMHNVLNFGNNMEHIMHHTAEFLSKLWSNLSQSIAGSTTNPINLFLQSLP